MVAAHEFQGALTSRGVIDRYEHRAAVGKRLVSAEMIEEDDQTCKIDEDRLNHMPDGAGIVKVKQVRAPPGIGGTRGDDVVNGGGSQVTESGTAAPEETSGLNACHQYRSLLLDSLGPRSIIPLSP